MSWDSYISDHLMAELPNYEEPMTLSHAAIIGLDGGIWAKSASFPNITPEQIASLAAGFDNQDGPLAAEGIKIGDEKYFLIPGEAGAVLRGRRGPEGLCIKKTHTAMIIGIYGEGVQGGDCNVLVEGLGDYLKDMGV